jgi:hypothetical protein
VILEMHLEAMIVRTGRPNRASLVIHIGGRDQARLDRYLEAIDGRLAGCQDSLQQLVDLQTWECDKGT